MKKTVTNQTIFICDKLNQKERLTDQEASQVQQAILYVKEQLD